MYQGNYGSTLTFLIFEDEKILCDSEYSMIFCKKKEKKRSLLITGRVKLTLIQTYFGVPLMHSNFSARLL